MCVFSAPWIGIKCQSLPPRKKSQYLMKENGGKRKVAFASLLSRPDCLIKYTTIKYIQAWRQNAATPRALNCSLPYVATSSSNQKKVVNLPAPVQSQTGRLYRLCYCITTRRENKNLFFLGGRGEGGTTHLSKWNIDPHFNPPPAFHTTTTDPASAGSFFPSILIRANLIGLRICWME